MGDERGLDGLGLRRKPVSELLLDEGGPPPPGAVQSPRTLPMSTLVRSLATLECVIERDERSDGGIDEAADVERAACPETWAESACTALPSCASTSFCRSTRRKMSPDPSAGVMSDPWCSRALRGAPACIVARSGTLEAPWRLCTWEMHMSQGSGAHGCAVWQLPEPLPTPPCPKFGPTGPFSTADVPKYGKTWLWALLESSEAHRTSR